MHGTAALSLRSTLAPRSIASKARKFKPPLSTPTSHANPPPAHPRPAAWVPPTGDTAAAQGSLGATEPPPSPPQPRAVPRATPFDAPRGGAFQRRPGEYREPPAVAAARSKSVGQRSVWESYLGPSPFLLLPDSISPSFCLSRTLPLTRSNPQSSPGTPASTSGSASAPLPSSASTAATTSSPRRTRRRRRAARLRPTPCRRSQGSRTA